MPAPVEKPRASADATDVTDPSEANGMQEVMQVVEHLMHGKKQKKTQRIGDLHSKLLQKVNATLEEVADETGRERTKQVTIFYEKLRAIKSGGEELADIVKQLGEKHAELESCSKKLDDISEKRETLSRKRDSLEEEHREGAKKTLPRTEGGDRRGTLHMREEPQEELRADIADAEDPRVHQADRDQRITCPTGDPQQVIDLGWFSGIWRVGCRSCRHLGRQFTRPHDPAVPFACSPPTPVHSPPKYLPPPRPPSHGAQRQGLLLFCCA
eukprot:TRINITY_DN1082_c0_g1_i14.p2 TRINITY_DN1082_c0_g1~~TRINITY_DN1082_c0_g1_i14.p2  ORF type:complete len:269 (+),score=39.51 TRINITY_DN1082_c0_g1_i14:245-1051(+)